MSSGLLNPSAFGVIAYTLLLTHITIAAVTIFLHRHQAHRALTLHPVASHFFRFWLWLTTGMVTRQWVAVHRKHHARCETADDPHSPQVLSLKKVLLEGAELYRREADNGETLAVYGKGTPDDAVERRLYSRYPYLGIVLMLALDVLLLGPIGITVWAVQMIWIPLFAAGVINGIGHYFGYRTYASPDAATNIVPWGILIGGEELHNNHHAYPGSARLSSQPWEFDIGWFYIRLLERMGLARVKKVAPSPARLLPTAAGPDPDTLRTIAVHRMQVLARYSRKVIKAAYRAEVRRLGGADPELRQARALLLREESLNDGSARRRLQQVLARSEALATVYRFRERLQAIWQGAAEGQALAALEQWRREAEASGVAALQEFARRIGGWRSAAG
ncbi:MAG: acyl-CoA desaturase [Gammaproteobacteria bacterium HGW-Gammaproteobacteria-1]|jgi:stearoyl-CoA desaturase (delta-9 desaturase)|nr:MAG: acyl-CoA desaturase [Gammaproteobacteria bacterium HGW-Gammaproteobacteria-1]